MSAEMPDAFLVTASGENGFFAAVPRLRIDDAETEAHEWRINGKQTEILSLYAGPIDIVLWCPSCGLQHVDEPDPAAGWTNPVHYTHLCKGCKHLWTPSNVPTNGVLGTDIGERKHDSRPVIRGRVQLRTLGLDGHVA